MGLINVQHPETKLWRQYSSYTDRWCCDWMPEDKYKEYLINQTIEFMKEEFETYGLKDKRMFTSIAEMDYNDKYRELCETCPNNHNCDDCSHNISLDEYLSLPDNPLGIDMTFDKGPLKERK